MYNEFTLRKLIGFEMTFDVSTLNSWFVVHFFNCHSFSVIRLLKKASTVADFLKAILLRGVYRGGHEIWDVETKTKLY